MEKRMRTYVVVSYYAGDGVWLGIRGYKGPKPRGFVRLVGSSRKCRDEASFLQESSGGGASNVIFESYLLDTAKKLFDLSV